MPTGSPRATLALLFLGVALACDRRAAQSGEESAVARDSIATAAATTASNWVAALGAMFVVPYDSQAGVVLFPDAPGPRLVASAPLRLIDAAGGTGDMPVSLVDADSGVCGEAVIVHLRDTSATPWTAGLLGSRAQPLRMDSVESFSAADSTYVVTELARLASTLPMRPESRFAGLPFAVLSARRFEVGARLVLVGHAVRRVPHEAAPVEEHTLIVAERDSTAGRRAPFTLGFQLRSEGAEDAVEQYEALAVLSNDTGTWLILSRENDARTVYQILERARDGTWRARWSRALAC